MGQPFTRSIHLLPIEPFEERYTSQWLKWWPEELEAEGFKVHVIAGSTAYQKRSGGEFLDPVGTWEWKGSQVQNFASWFRDGNVKDGDWVLSLDGWGPGTTAAAYIRDATGVQFKIAVFFHAGSYDPADFLSRSGMGRWALSMERGWMEAADLILVGSQFHQNMLTETLGVTPWKIGIVGNPIHQKELWEAAYPIYWEDRPKLVVFPHRLAPEKAPDEFDQIAAIHREKYPIGHKGSRWVKTYEWFGQTGKPGYYRTLARSRVVVSTAYQETFGIAMQEGIALGSWAVAPKRLAYPEVIREGSGLLYDTLEHAADLVNICLKSSIPSRWDGHHEHAIKRATNHIKRISRVE